MQTAFKHENNQYGDIRITVSLEQNISDYFKNFISWRLFKEYKSGIFSSFKNKIL